jgi:hypothetical protein
LSQDLKAPFSSKHVSGCHTQKDTCVKLGPKNEKRKPSAISKVHETTAQLWTQNEANKMGCGGSHYHHWVLLMRRVEELVSLHLQSVMTTKQHQETQVSRFLGKYVKDTVKEVNSVQTDLRN